MEDRSGGLTINDIRRSTPGPCVVIAAHPDDEVIGASSFLLHRPDVTLVYVTDGAPRDERLWPAGVPSTRSGYAALRRAESDAALAHVRIGRDRIRRLGFSDQEVAYDLVSLSRVVLDLIGELNPRTILVQPYEGGHPDHDACAFAVRAATTLASNGARTLLEMTSYHAALGGLVTGRFIPSSSFEHVCPFTIEERDNKVRMLACFESQREILQHFSVEDERFRRAPAYDFTRPPHPGRLHYETVGWPMRSRRWCELAAQALEHLEIEDRLPTTSRGGDRSWA